MMIHDTPSLREDVGRVLALVEGTTVPGRFTTPHPFVGGPDVNEDVRRFNENARPTGDGEGWTIRWPSGTFVRSGGEVPTRDPLEGEASGDVVRVDPPSAWVSGDEFAPDRITATALIDEDGRLCLTLRFNGELVGEASAPGERVTLAVEMP